MTSPQGLPVGMAYPLHPADPDLPEEEKTGPTVGASDADADAAASGADTEADLTDASRDSDGVPVGEADAEADRRNSGA